MMIVLDTNVISELMRKRPTRRVLTWVDAQSAGDLAITSVTAAELLYGIARLDDGARKRELGDAVRLLVHEDLAGRVLPFDVPAAEHYADLVADRERHGRPITSADGQIAAICRRHDATLATRNTRDFEATGVELLDPWAAG
jgi:predicted nucleic acid-binding protein